MAQERILDTQLRLVFEVGPDLNGVMKVKNKNYNNVKTSATAEQLLAVGTALIGLQSLTSAGIERNDAHQIIQ